VRKNILATAMLSAALAMGFKEEVKIKKAVQIARNWKEDQEPNDRLNALEKAKEKRLRKAKIKARNLQRSKHLI